MANGGLPIWDWRVLTVAVAVLLYGIWSPWRKDLAASGRSSTPR
jgi:hypothetical protein